MRLRFSLGACLVFLGGCFQPSCNFHLGCQNDAECATDEVCDYSSCVTVELCTKGVCPGDATCVTRPESPAGNPFESPTPGKQICDCHGYYETSYCDPSQGGDGGTGGYGGGATGGGGSGGSVGCLSAPPSGEPVSAERFGDAEESGGSLLAAVDQGTLMAFPFKGTIDLGGGLLESKGDTDVGVALRASDGTTIWSASLGGAGPDVLTALGSMSGDAALAVSFTGSLQVGDVTLDAAGGAAAAVITAGESMFLKPILLTSTGTVTVSSVGEGGLLDDVTVAGTFNGKLDVSGVSLTSSGGTDGFVLHVDRGTAIVHWAYQLGGPGDQEITAALRGPGGSTYAVGSFLGETWFDGQSTSSDGRDGMILSLDNDGLEIKSRVIGGPDRQVLSAMALDPQGGLFIAGARASESMSQGQIDFGGGITLEGSGLVDTFVAKIDPQFDYPWISLIPGAAGTGEVIPRAIAYDCAGQLTVVGQSTSSPALAAPGSEYGKYDAFACKIEGGNVLWGHIFGGPEDDQATGVVPLGGDAILVGGSFAGAGTFGATELTSAGADDTFLLTLKP